MKRAAAILALLSVALSGCGYHISGRGDTVPKTIRTIAVSAFSNGGMRYQLARLLPTDITREFISRTRYAIVSETNEADAVLTGAVANYVAVPIVSDPKSGRATAVQVLVTINVTLTERRTGKVLFSFVGRQFPERYEVALDPDSYFDESGTAMVRVSKDVARSVVSAVLEGF